MTIFKIDMEIYNYSWQNNTMSGIVCIDSSSNINVPQRSLESFRHEK